MTFMMHSRRAFAAPLVVLFFVLLAGCGTKPAPVIKPAAPEQPPEPELTGTELILTQIAELLAQGAYTEAIVRFDDIDDEDAATVGIRQIKAGVLLSAGRTRDARALIRELIALEPENPDLLFVLASVEGAEGKAKEYRATLDQIIRIDPDHLDALLSLGSLQLQNRSWRNAATWFDRALAVDAQNGEALVGRAQVYRQTKAPEKAEELLDRAIALYPAWPAPYSERAQLYRYYGNYAEALEDLTKAKELSPDSYWVACDMGNVLLSLNRRADALAEYSRAARIEPDNFLAYVYLAGLKDDLGDFAGAEQAYITLARLKPDYYFAFEGVGMHKMKNREWAAARDAFREAWNRAQDQWAYALLAGACWMRAERRQAPREFLQTAMRRFQRETLEWYMLRLYAELSGDTDVSSRIERERSPITKARMSFYLALYYDVLGSKTLADRYFLQVRQLDQKAIPEWRLNEWMIAERGLAAE
jgi:tetratricopeptide (TPR) repeat protein